MTAAKEGYTAGWTNAVAGGLVHMDAEGQRFCNCGTRLRRDNSGKLCETCQRSHKSDNSAPPIVPAEFWDEPSMREALASWHIGKVVTAYRHHPFHGKILVQEQVGGWVGMAQAQMSRLEGGPTVEDLSKLRMWARVLKIPEKVLWFKIEKNSNTSEIDLRSATVGDWESPADVAARLQVISAADVGGSVLDIMELTLADVIARYESEGPRKLSTEVLQTRRLSQSLLEGWQHPKQRERTYRIAAHASALLAYMAVNVGKFALAESYSVEGGSLADAVDDVNLRMWIYGTKSFRAYYLGDYERARDLARSGVSLNPNSPQAIRLLSNGEARALGMLGDVDGVDRAVGEALRLTEALDISPDLTSCISFAPYGYSRLAANAATAYVPLGSVARVVEYIGGINSAVEDADSNWSRSLTKLDVATALLRQPNPEVEQAMSLGREALAASPGRPIESIAQRAGALKLHAKVWSDHNSVREYADALRVWRSA